MWSNDCLNSNIKFYTPRFAPSEFNSAPGACISKNYLRNSVNIFNSDSDVVLTSTEIYKCIVEAYLRSLTSVAYRNRPWTTRRTQCITRQAYATDVRDRSQRRKAGLRTFIAIFFDITVQHNIKLIWHSDWLIIVTCQIITIDRVCTLCTS